MLQKNSQIIFSSIKIKISSTKNKYYTTIVSLWISIWLLAITLTPDREFLATETNHAVMETTDRIHVRTVTMVTMVQHETLNVSIAIKKDILLEIAIKSNVMIQIHGCMHLNNS